MQALTNEQIDIIARDWPTLDTSSIVFEVGAYKGRWACDIYDKYKCNVYAFEPQDWAYEILWDESVKRSSLFPFHFALGPYSSVMTLHNVGTDACTFVHEHSPVTNPDTQKAYIRDIREFLRANHIDHIDLMMINIEGFEYELIRYIITSGVIHSIETLCVQWHPFADRDKSKYQWIRDYLERFYQMKVDIYPTLEVWERKN